MQTLNSVLSVVDRLPNCQNLVKQHINISSTKSVQLFTLSIGKIEAADGNNYVHLYALLSAYMITYSTDSMIKVILVK